MYNFTKTINNRVTDVNSLYPSQDILDEVKLDNKYAHPQYHYYFCYDKMQLFFTCIRSKYCVFSRFFQSRDFRSVSVRRFNRYDYYYYKGKDYEKALACFRELCREILVTTLCDDKILPSDSNELFNYGSNIDILRL